MSCHLGWVPLILALLTPYLALHLCKPKTITIFIQSGAPLAYSESDFRSAVHQAMHEWYGRAGFKVVRVYNHEEADIFFYSNQLGSHQGRVFPEPYPQFPHFPRKGEGVMVCIDSDCRNIYPVLLHEIGHTLGLRHRSDSIMQIESPRPQNLTHKDFESIKQLKGIQ